MTAALVEYKSISKKTLQESIESEMSGNLEKILVAIGEGFSVSCIMILNFHHEGPSRLLVIDTCLVLLDNNLNGHSEGGTVSCFM